MRMAPMRSSCRASVLRRSTLLAAIADTGTWCAPLRPLPRLLVLIAHGVEELEALRRRQVAKERARVADRVLCTEAAHDVWRAVRKHGPQLGVAASLHAYAGRHEPCAASALAPGAA